MQLKKKFDWKLLGRFLGYLKGHSPQLVLMYIMTLIQVGATIAIPYIIKVGIDTYISAGNARGLIMISLVLAAVLAGLYVSARVQGKLLAAVGYTVLYRLRRDLFTKLQDLSFRFFDSHKTGQIMTRITSDVQVLEELLQGGLNTIFVDILMLAGIIVMMLVLDLRLSIVLFVTIPLFAVLVFFVRGRMMHVARGIQAKLSAVNAFLNESISGIKVIRSFAREETNAANFRKINNDYYGAARKFYPINAFFWQSVTTISNLGTALVLAGGGILLARGLVSVGVIAAFLSYITRFFQPMQKLSNLLYQMSRAMASCERVFEILDEQPEITDCGNPFKPPVIMGDVRFENIHFWYNRDEPVLKGISFSAKAGQTVAVVGSTGAGKTTLINLLCRFYDPVRGKVLIDGKDLRKYGQEAYRSHIAIVMQESIIFSGTIIDNIRYGNPTATEDEIHTVAAKMGIHEMFMSMPAGYNTLIGERGSSLSLGQKQLVAFTRALVRNPSILVLDEASAYIDTNTEALVQHAMKELSAKRTTFIIAHRLSTIRDADMILVMNEGRMIESGTHAELASANGIYSTLLKTKYAAL
ncbi:MAG: ABC transporter ATP-binding protein [Spirochaetales bacterium]|nr:ABC transporter ATP-binding protein [Spirochaetales bacterium]